MSKKNLEESLALLTKKIEGLENQVKDLQSQQLETGQNIVTSNSACRNHE